MKTKKVFYIELPLVCLEKKLLRRNTFKLSMEEKLKMVYNPALSTCNRPYLCLLIYYRQVNMTFIIVNCCYLKRRVAISELFSTQCAMERMGNSFRTSFLENCSCLHIILAEKFYYCWKHAAFIFCCLNFQENLY